MFGVKCFKLLYCTAVLSILIFGAALNFVPDPDFGSHFLTNPRVYHAVHKREISSSKETEERLKHLDHLSVVIDLCGQERILDLQLNRGLIPKNYFEKHQNEGEYITKKPQAQDVELCHYGGDIRGIPSSWVAVSTCNGLRGIIFDGHEVYYIETTIVTNSTNPFADTHVIYKHSDLKSNFTCGFKDDTPHHLANHGIINAKHARYRRDAGTIHGPYNSNRLSRYIELVLVIDNKEYRALDEDVTKVHQHCKDIANIINSLYVPLNIFVALVGVVIWKDFDEFPLETNGDKTLTSFLTYRKERLVKDHPNDNAQLLTKLQFEGGVVGKALKGPICTFEFSGGVNMDHSSVVGLVATTIAHEMGHNLGMEHDTENSCTCPEGKCIMSPSSSSSSPSEWSSCSREYLTVAFEHGMDYCLRNKPTSLFDGPVCGNGFVESGEQCDCGLKDKCDNPCCNATTCMLYANASCATGKCCDFQTCKPRSAGTICRTADHECDLPEYCTGESEYCPDDVFKIDGESCDRGNAFCYQGNCRSHNDQCKILWGPSGASSDEQCYSMNKNGNRHGNCGYNRLNQSYIKCEENHTYCGMLQCRHFNERLEFGMESVAILSHSYINSNRSIIPCRTAIVDLGLNEIDPGLTPDGAKCGENMMCLNQKCLSVSAVRSITVPKACEHGCHGNGICNSKGHCHCDKGYDPPHCDISGFGGSVDSGPAENPADYNGLRTVFFYMMLTLVPLVLVLFLYSYYIRKSPSYFWKRNQRRTIHCEKSVQIQINRDGHHGNGSINSTVQSLLPNTVKTAKAGEDVNSLRNSFIGHFKGFSITPLANGSAVKDAAKPVPTRPAPPPVHNVPVVVVRPMRTAPMKPCTPAPSSPTQDSPTEMPCLPPPNVTTVPNRPSISFPVLDNTTSSTVKSLINKNLPVRPAPPVPSAKTPRPNSTPCMLDTVDHPADKPNVKEQTLTLNRIASFISKSQTPKAEERKEVTSLKAAKIDKDTLKNLTISDPIPLNEPSIPVNPLPLSKDQEKCVVMRAQSLRQVGPKQRPGIQSFGSVRLSGSRRPTSIPACSRPTSPPPCPPQGGHPATAKSGYDYDLEDNIYAVIEEHPVEEEAKVTGSSAPLKSPVLDNSDGLLKEIVNEIQARNMDSIYSNDGGGGKNEEGSPSAVNDDRLYENTSALKSSASLATSSEYLKPITSADGNPKPAETVARTSPMKVPEKTAPGYRPFNTAKKPITSVHAKKQFSSEKKNDQPKAFGRIGGANSSQEKRADSTVLGGGPKSSVSSVVNKFNTANVLGKTTPLVTKPSNVRSNAAAKTNVTAPEKTASGTDVPGSRFPKTSTVASMQKKFEVPSKATSSNSSSKVDRPNFKR